MAERKRRKRFDTVAKEVFGRPEVSQSLIDAGILIVGAKYAPKLASRGMRRKMAGQVMRVVRPRRYAEIQKMRTARRTWLQVARGASMQARRENRMTMSGITPAKDSFKLATDADHPRWRRPAEKRGTLRKEWFNADPQRGGSMGKGDFFRRMSNIKSPKANLLKRNRRITRIFNHG
jgi:hypothetical protein